MSNEQVADQALHICKKEGAECLVEVAQSYVKELSIESNQLNLLRTNFDQSLSVKVFRDGQSATGSSNQFDTDSVQAATHNALQAAAASPKDLAHQLAPSQGQDSMSFGLTEANDEWALKCFHGFLKTVRGRFPNLILESSVLKFVRREALLASSNGTRLKSAQGYYNGSVMFTTKDQGSSSSFNYTGFVLGAGDLKNPNFDLMTVSGVEALLQQSTEQTKVKKIPEKFSGDVIVTPHCMESLIESLLGHLTTQPLLTRTSLFQDKLGQLVASPKFTVTARPRSLENNDQVFWTRDGYRCENEEIFANGVLKRYLLDQYGANKLKQTVSRSMGYNLQQQSGDVALQEMIGSIKKGVLLCRLSADEPASNGDFSGVAKNSYYIENGKISYALGETMVSGNLLKMFGEVKGVSKESLNFGSSQFPWSHFSDMVIS